MKKAEGFFVGVGENDFVFWVGTVCLADEIRSDLCMRFWFCMVWDRDPGFVACIGGPSDVSWGSGSRYVEVSMLM